MDTREYKEVTSHDIHSTENQDILSKLVQREVGHCLTSLVSELIEARGFEWLDKAENMTYYACPECGEQAQEDDHEENTTYKCSDCDWQSEEQPDMEYADVYEWWAVDRMLYNDLYKRGEVVMDAGSVLIWGRQCTGQAIMLDGVIARMAVDMEILQGQRNDWSR